MITKEALKEFGANVDEGLGRCFGNENLYLRLVGKCCEGKEVEKLEEGLAEGDLDKAFEAAHALKGVAGNLSLTPMYDELNKMLVDLRERKPVDYSASMAYLKEKMTELRALCK